MIDTNHVDDWWLIKDDPKVIHEEVREADGTLKGYRKRNLFTVIRERYIYRLTTFATEIDRPISSFLLRTGPDTTVSVSYTGKKYYCVSAPRELVDPITGKYKETQTWIHKSEGDLEPVNHFEGSDGPTG